MSLHQIAQDVQSRGRGEDSVLIHMTPKEVGGLQALAMAGGGSLTINPDTGLPEAGFLSSLLPTLIGAGLSFIPGVGPLMAAGLVGGGTALATGNIQKGLMAGLGAYGGAGLASGLAGAGIGAAQQAAQAAVPEALAGVQGAATTSAADLAQQAAMAKSNAAIEATRQFMPPDIAAKMGQGMATPSAIQTTTQMPVMDRIGAGFKALGTESGRDLALQSMGGGKKALQYGLAALAPSAMGMQPEYRQPEEEAPYLYQFNREQQAPTRQGPYTSEQQYFTAPTLTRIPGYAEGGMTGASQEAFDYLMGRSDVSPARAAAQERMASLPAQAPVMPAATTAAPAASGTVFGRAIREGQSDSPMFNFDPRTGGLVLIARPEPVQPAYRDRDYGGGGGDGYGGFGGDSGDSGGFGGVNGSAGHGSGEGTSMAAQGGIVGLAKGGMAKGGFVVPADVVSMLGEGSTDAGIRALQAKYGPAAKAIKGPGTGQSDSIKTTIEGKQPALVADGEVYVPPAVVQRHGGAKKFYSMLDNVRTASQGHTKQQRRVNPERVMA